MGQNFVRLLKHHFEYQKISEDVLLPVVHFLVLMSSFFGGSPFCKAFENDSSQGILFEYIKKIPRNKV